MKLDTIRENSSVIFEGFLIILQIREINTAILAGGKKF